MSFRSTVRRLSGKSAKSCPGAEEDGLKITVAAAENTHHAHQRLVNVGVDPHFDSHVAVALDEIGQRLEELHFPATEAGYNRFLKWTRTLGELEQVGMVRR